MSDRVVLDESNADLILSDMDHDNPKTILLWMHPEGLVIKATAINDVPVVEILDENQAVKEANDLCVKGFAYIGISDDWNAMQEHQNAENSFGIKGEGRCHGSLQ